MLLIIQAYKDGNSCTNEYEYNITEQDIKEFKELLEVRDR